ncbi:hypothetical protein TNCV_1991181 [Trichonephila clavipes]|nr:hypothetical protein TNCV_1991181 [Trichonephila clavipes]
MRRQPNHQTFARVHQNLAEHGSFRATIDDTLINSEIDLVARISNTCVTIRETPENYYWRPEMVFFILPTLQESIENVEITEISTKAEIQSRLLLWIHAPADTEGQLLLDLSSLSLTDSDAIARRELTSYAVKKYVIPEINCNHVISTTIVRLRTRHFKGIEISPDGQRSYNTCPHCPNIQLSPNHIFNCPSILAELHNFVFTPQHSVSPTDQRSLGNSNYLPKVVDIARAFLDAI